MRVWTKKSLKAFLSDGSVHTEGMEDVTAGHVQGLYCDECGLGAEVVIELGALVTSCFICEDCLKTAIGELRAARNG